MQTLNEKSIAIQNMRIQRYDRAVKGDNGSKELVDLRNRNTFVKYFIMVLINIFMTVWYFCWRKLEESITVHYPAPGHYCNNSNSDRSSRRIQCSIQR